MASIDRSDGKERSDTLKVLDTPAGIQHQTAAGPGYVVVLHLPWTTPCP